MKPKIFWFDIFELMEVSFKIRLLNLKATFAHDFLMHKSPNIETYFNSVQLNVLQMKYKKLNFEVFLKFFSKKY